MTRGIDPQDIEQGGDAKAMEYAAKFDRKYEGNVMLTQAEIEAACALVPEKLKADIQFAHDNVKRFAELQKSTVATSRWKFSPGMSLAKRRSPLMRQAVMSPVAAIATSRSAIMTVTTAKVAGCKPYHRPVLHRAPVWVWLPRSSMQRIFAVQIKSWRWAAFKALRR